MGEPGRSSESTDRVLTVPNALSTLRIALIPVFVWLIVDRDTTFGGLVLFGIVLSTDWVDGAIARATGQVSELGKVVALVARGAFPLWAALPILVRDGAVLVAGIVLLARRGARIEVRYLGKIATFGLMTAIGCIAWGTLGYAFAPAFLACGWVVYSVAIVESYVATVSYVGDLRDALAA
jgi:phosphatidylglycerophosphate synthase